MSVVRTGSPRRYANELDGTVGSAYASMSVTSPASTTIVAPGLPVKMAGTTTLSVVGPFDDDGGTNNRIRYTGGSDILVKVDAWFDIDAAVFDKLVLLLVSHNANPLIGTTLVSAAVASAAEVRRASSFGMIQLAPGDTLEVYVGNGTDTTAITVGQANVLVHKVSQFA